MEQAHDFTDAVRDRDWHSEGHAYSSIACEASHSHRRTDSSWCIPRRYRGQEAFTVTRAVCADFCGSEQFQPSGSANMHACGRTGRGRCLSSPFVTSEACGGHISTLRSSAMVTGHTRFQESENTLSLCGHFATVPDHWDDGANTEELLVCLSKCMSNGTRKRLVDCEPWSTPLYLRVRKMLLCWSVLSEAVLRGILR